MRIILRVAVFSAVIVRFALVASAAPLDPDDSSVAGSLQLWLKSDAGVEEADGDDAESGDGVMYWRDQSGKTGSRDASQSVAVNRPQYLTDSLCGKPVIRFDDSTSGEQDWLLGPLTQEILGLPESDRTPSGGATFFVVFRPIAESGGVDEDYIMQFTRNAEGSSLISLAIDMIEPSGAVENTLSVFFRNPGGTPVFNWMEQAGAVADDDVFIASYGFDDSANTGLGELYASVSGTSLDDSPIEDQLFYDATGDAGVYIGRAASTTYNWRLSGDIAEIIVYDTALTSTQIAGIEQYL